MAGGVLGRCLVCATSFGCCFAAALLVAALGTERWADARARRTSNPLESDGRVQFGLFAGRKDLNVAYGWRTYEVDVIHLLKYEPEFLIYGFWLGTVVCVCGALFFSAIGAVFALINTATKTERCIARVSTLYVWNALSLIFDAAAVGFWVTQFYMKIQENVMTREDRDNMWTSQGMAELGYSFWFVVGAGATSFVNIIVIFIAKSEREVENVIPVLEEKTNGAIMLY